MNRSQLAATAAALTATFALGACGDGGQRSRLASYDNTLAQSLTIGDTVVFGLHGNPDIQIRQTNASISCTGPNGRTASYEEIPLGGVIKMNDGTETILPYNVSRVDQLIVGYCAEDIKNLRELTRLVDRPTQGF